MNFQVSDKVVLVDDQNWHDPIPGMALPRLGEVYVVRDVWVSNDDFQEVVVQLVGFPEYLTPILKIRRGFRAKRFRKLEEVQLIVKALKHQNTPCPHTTPSSS